MTLEAKADCATSAMTSVVVGYGHAGRDLHHRALHGLYGSTHPVLLVDPAGLESYLPVRRVAAIEQALAEVDPQRSVFHIATPPADHLPTVRRLVAGGARHLIVEKPVATSTSELDQLRQATDRVNVLGVSVWSNSAVTQHVRTALQHGSVGPLVSLHFEQSKPRFGLSRDSTTHVSAFDVELPHQVLLAVDLVGPVREVLSARYWPMQLSDRSLPTMGGALVRLEHVDGVVSTLLTDLTSPVRRRRLRLVGTRNQVVADYPISSADAFGQVSAGGCAERIVVEDEPMTQFLSAAYRYFATQGPYPPGSRLDVHAHCIDVLERTRALALPIQPSERECVTCNG